MATAQFTSRVSLVEVYATVVDAGGNPVAHLTRDDFIVEEDGRPQPIQVFTAGDFPLSLAIAVDRSFSVSRDRLQQQVFASQRLLGELRPDDHVLALAVGSSVVVLSALSADHRAAYDALTGLQPWGTTPLYDAVRSAIEQIQNTAGRRALILMTDGGERYSTLGAAEMIRFARERDVIVYPVVFGRAAPPSLSDLATVTGGRAVAVPDLRQLSSTLSALARELRAQYLLGYAPPEDRPATRDDQWRSITVKVRRADARVRARDGYVFRSRN